MKRVPQRYGDIDTQPHHKHRIRTAREKRSRSSSVTSWENSSDSEAEEAERRIRGNRRGIRTRESISDRRYCKQDDEHTERDAFVQALAVLQKAANTARPRSTYERRAPLDRAQDFSATQPQGRPEKAAVMRGLSTFLLSNVDVSVQESHIASICRQLGTHAIRTSRQKDSVCQQIISTLESGEVAKVQKPADESEFFDFVANCKEAGMQLESTEDVLIQLQSNEELDIAIEHFHGAQINGRVVQAGIVSRQTRSQ